MNSSFVIRASSFTTLTPLLVAAGILTALLLSLGGHPLYGDSEARYATIARAMAHGQSPLLIPHWFGEPHVTKPPLYYWILAGSISLLGDHGWAIRLPSVLAGGLSLAATYILGGRLLGRRRAGVAVMLMAVSPMFLAISRSGITDAWLSLWGVLALFGGALAVTEPRSRRWPLLFWVATALGLLTKGPAALLPAGALLLWTRWCHGRAGVGALRLGWGLPLSVTPLLLWAGWVTLRLGESASPLAIWRVELLDRAIGTGDHPEPWWFFIPVALVGFFPASLFLLKGPSRVSDVHSSMNRLWWIACGLTFAVFTLITGKLMSYLAPLTAPVALLAARPILAWISAPRPAPPAQIPGGGGPLAGAVGLAIAVGVGAVLLWQWMGPSQAMWLWPGALTAAVGIAVGCLGPGHPTLRRRGMLLLWGTLVAAAMWAGVLEDRMFTPDSARSRARAVRAMTGLAHPRILTVGFVDPPLAYYTNRPTGRVDPRFIPEVWAALRKDNLVLLAEPWQWKGFAGRPAHLLDRWYARVGTLFHVERGKDLWVFRPRPEHW